MLDSDDIKLEIIRKIKKRFDQLPNTGYMEIWLQRVSKPIDETISYSEPICRLVYNETQELWNIDWISSRQLKNLLGPTQIIDHEKLEDLNSVIPIEEVELFTHPY